METFCQAPVPVRRDVRELGHAVRGRVVAGHAQADVDVGHHRDGLIGALRLPRLAVRGGLRLERIVRAGDPDPVRGRDRRAGPVGAGAGAAGGGAILLRATVVRRHHRSRRAWSRRRDSRES